MAARNLLLVVSSSSSSHLTLKQTRGLEKSDLKMTLVVDGVIDVGYFMSTFTVKFVIEYYMEN